MSILSHTHRVPGCLPALATLALTTLLAGYPLAGASAQTMYRPADVSTDMGQLTNLYSISHVIDGSGLSTGYTSGVTNLASYNATHNSSLPENVWVSALFSQTGSVTFDMGSGFSTPLASFVFWNDMPTFPTPISGFALAASNDATFSFATALGSFSPSNPPGGTDNAVIKEVFSFTPTTARYFRMTITGNIGNTNASGFGEAAFAGILAANSPEPGTLVLLALGTGVLATRFAGGGIRWMSRGRHRNA